MYALGVYSTFILRHYWRSEEKGFKLYCVLSTFLTILTDINDFIFRQYSSQTDYRKSNNFINIDMLFTSNALG